MADIPKGTDSFESIENDCSWCILDEAECVDDIDTLKDLFDNSTDGSDVSNLIDDVDNASQGNSLALFNRQLTEETNKDISALKRKYIKSPQQQIAALSPRLQAVKITPEGKSRRRLFQDSGIEEDETPCVSQVVSNVENAAKDAIDLLRCSNRKATLLSKFKDLFGVSFNELTRIYRSDKTCSCNWTVAVFNAAEEVLEASKIQLQQHVDFMQIIIFGFYALYLIEFKTAKSRETLLKLLCQLLNVSEYQLLCDPPKLRSVPVAIYFYKRSLSNASFKFGDFPPWLSKQIMLDHQLSSSDSFSLSDMVQWAFDNNYTDDSEIAYNYALFAAEDANAAAFLQHNNQAKFVKDCSTMVKHYKRYEMRKMSMSAWIKKCSSEYNVDGNWKIIAQFLRTQNVNVVEFLIALKPFLKGVPKQNCLVFWGPPDTGKSMFCFSLLQFLKGKVISYINSKSQFWLMPLLDGKIGLLDDATYPCWQYMDINLRNAMDGNPFSIDAKHRNPVQLNLPPLLVTTNIDVKADNALKYLHSRIKCFHFPNKLIVQENGEIAHKITNETWACFFTKFASQLDIVCEDDEDGDTGDTDRTFQCTARRNSDSY